MRLDETQPSARRVLLLQIVLQIAGSGLSNIVTIQSYYPERMLHFQAHSTNLVAQEGLF